MKTNYSKWSILIGSSFASVFFILFTWFLLFLSQSILSGNQIWLILILINFLSGVFSVFIVIVLKDTWLHFYWKTIVDFIGASSIIYGIHLSNFLITKNIYFVWVTFTLFIIAGWVISFYFANRGINHNFEVNVSTGAINIENRLWDLQKTLAYTQKGGDDKRADKLLAIGRVLIPLGPALGILISRSNSISFSAMAIAILGAIVLLLISTSGQSAGIAKFVKSFEKENNIKFRIKTLE
jgi:hypothetical protein